MQTNHYIIPSRYSSSVYQRRINVKLIPVYQCVERIVNKYLDDVDNYYNLPVQYAEYVREHTEVDCHYTPGIPKDLMEEGLYPGPGIFVDIIFRADLKYPYYLSRTLNLMYSFNGECGTLRDILTYNPELDYSNEFHNSLNKLSNWLFLRLEDNQNKVYREIRKAMKSDIDEFNRDIVNKGIHL